MTVACSTRKNLPVCLTSGRGKGQLAATPENDPPKYTRKNKKRNAPSHPLLPILRTRSSRSFAAAPPDPSQPLLPILRSRSSRSFAAAPPRTSLGTPPGVYNHPHAELFYKKRVSWSWQRFRAYVRRVFVRRNVRKVDGARRLLMS
jgi:hypothetical protein